MSAQAVKKAKGVYDYMEGQSGDGHPLSHWPAGRYERVVLRTCNSIRFHLLRALQTAGVDRDEVERQRSALFAPWNLVNPDAAADSIDARARLESPIVKIAMESAGDDFRHLAEAGRRLPGLTEWDVFTTLACHIDRRTLLSLWPNPPCDPTPRLAHWGPPIEHADDPRLT